MLVQAVQQVVQDADCQSVALMGHGLIQEAQNAFRAAQIPTYAFPERAASALAVLAQRARIVSSGHRRERTGHRRAFNCCGTTSEVIREGFPGREAMST